MKPLVVPMSREVRRQLCMEELQRPSSEYEELRIPYGCDHSDLALAMDELLNREDTESMVTVERPVAVPPPPTARERTRERLIAIGMWAGIIFGYALWAAAGLGVLRLAYLGIVWLGGGK